MQLTVRKLLLPVLVVLLMATVNAAHAAGANRADHPTAYNLKSQVLTANPTDNMVEGHVSRSIYLEAGTYYVSFQRPYAQCNYEVPVVSGTFEWRGLLDPKNGYYRESAVLDGSGGVFHLGYCNWSRIPQDGSYSWGTSLYLCHGTNPVTNPCIDRP